MLQKHDLSKLPELPVELLALIFYHLPEETLHILARTCKALNTFYCSLEWQLAFYQTAFEGSTLHLHLDEIANTDSLESYYRSFLPTDWVQIKFANPDEPFKLIKCINLVFECDGSMKHTTIADLIGKSNLVENTSQLLPNTALNEFRDKIRALANHLRDQPTQQVLSIAHWLHSNNLSVAEKLELAKAYRHLEAPLKLLMLFIQINNSIAGKPTAADSNNQPLDYAALLCDRRLNTWLTSQDLLHLNYTVIITPWELQWRFHDSLTPTKLVNVIGQLIEKAIKLRQESAATPAVIDNLLPIEQILYRLSDSHLQDHLYKDLSHRERKKAHYSPISPWLLTAIKANYQLVGEKVVSKAALENLLKYYSTDLVQLLTYCSTAENVPLILTQDCSHFIQQPFNEVVKKLDNSNNFSLPNSDIELVLTIVERAELLLKDLQTIFQQKLASDEHDPLSVYFFVQRFSLAELSEQFIEVNEKTYNLHDYILALLQNNEVFYLKLKRSPKITAAIFEQVLPQRANLFASTHYSPEQIQELISDVSLTTLSQCCCGSSQVFKAVGKLLIQRISEEADTLAPATLVDYLVNYLIAQWENLYDAIKAISEDAEKATTAATFVIFTDYLIANRSLFNRFVTPEVLQLFCCAFSPGPRRKKHFYGIRPWDPVLWLTAQPEVNSHLSDDMLVTLLLGNITDNPRNKLTALLNNLVNTQRITPMLFKALCQQPLLKYRLALFVLHFPHRDTPESNAFKTVLTACVNDVFDLIECYLNDSLISFTKKVSGFQGVSIIAACLSYEQILCLWHIAIKIICFPEIDSFFESVWLFQLSRLAIQEGDDKVLIDQLLLINYPGTLWPDKSHIWKIDKLNRALELPELFDRIWQPDARDYFYQCCFAESNRPISYTFREVFFTQLARCKDDDDFVNLLLQQQCLRALCQQETILWKRFQQIKSDSVLNTLFNACLAIPDTELTCTLLLAFPRLDEEQILQLAAYLPVKYLGAILEIGENKLTSEMLLSLANLHNESQSGVYALHLLNYLVDQKPALIENLPFNGRFTIARLAITGEGSKEELCSLLIQTDFRKALFLEYIIKLLPLSAPPNRYTLERWFIEQLNQENITSYPFIALLLQHTPAEKLITQWLADCELASIQPALIDKLHQALQMPESYANVLAWLSGVAVNATALENVDFHWADFITTQSRDGFLQWLKGFLAQPDVMDRLPTLVTVLVSFQRKTGKSNSQRYVLIVLDNETFYSQLEQATSAQRAQLTQAWFLLVNEYPSLADELFAISLHHPLLQRADWLQQYPADAWCTLCLSIPDNIKNHLPEQFKPLFHEIFERRLHDWRDSELQTLQSAFAKQPKLFFILSSELTYRLNRQRDQFPIYPLQAAASEFITFRPVPVWCRTNDLLCRVFAHLDDEALWPLRLVNLQWYRAARTAYHSEEQRLQFYQAAFQGSTLWQHLSGLNTHLTDTSKVYLLSLLPTNLPVDFTFVDRFLGHWSTNQAPLYSLSDLFSHNNYNSPHNIKRLKRKLRRLLELYESAQENTKDKVQPSESNLSFSERIGQLLDDTFILDDKQNQPAIEAEKQSPEDQKALTQQRQKQVLALARLYRRVEAKLNLLLLRIIIHHLVRFEGNPEENDQIRHIIWHSRLTRWLSGRDIVVLNELEVLDWNQSFVMSAYLKNLTHTGLELQRKAMLTEEEKVQQVHIMQVLFRLSDEDLLFYIARLPAYLQWSRTTSKQPSQLEATVIATAISYCVLFQNDYRLQLIVNTVGAERFGCALFQLNAHHVGQLLQQYPALMRAWFQSLSESQREQIEQQAAIGKNDTWAFDDYWSYWQNPATHGFIPRKTFLQLFARVFVHKPANQPLCLYYFLKHVSWNQLVSFQLDVIETLLSLFQTRPDVLSQLFAKDTMLGSEWLTLLFKQDEAIIKLAQEAGHAITLAEFRAGYQPLVCWLSAEQTIAMVQALATSFWFEILRHNDSALDRFWQALFAHRRMTTALFTRFLEHPAFYPLMLQFSHIPLLEDEHVLLLIAQLTPPDLMSFFARMLAERSHLTLALWQAISADYQMQVMPLLFQHLASIAQDDVLVTHLVRCQLLTHIAHWSPELPARVKGITDPQAMQVIYQQAMALPKETHQPLVTDVLLHPPFFAQWEVLQLIEVAGYLQSMDFPRLAQQVFSHPSLTSPLLVALAQKNGQYALVIIQAWLANAPTFPVEFADRLTLVQLAVTADVSRQPFCPLLANQAFQTELSLEQVVALLPVSIGQNRQQLQQLLLEKLCVIAVSDDVLIQLLQQHIQPAELSGLLHLLSEANRNQFLSRLAILLGQSHVQRYLLENLTSTFVSLLAYQSPESIRQWVIQFLSQTDAQPRLVPLLQQLVTTSQQTNQLQFIQCALTISETPAVLALAQAEPEQGIAIACWRIKTIFNQYTLSSPETALLTTYPLLTPDVLATYSFEALHQLCLAVPRHQRRDLSDWLPEVYREVFIQRIQSWTDEQLLTLLALFPAHDRFSLFDCEGMAVIKAEQNRRAEMAFKQQEYDNVAAGMDVTRAPKWYRVSRLNIHWLIRLMLGVGGAVAFCFGLSVLIPWLALPAVMISVAVVCGLLALATPKLMTWYESHFALLFQGCDKTPSNAELVFAQTAPDLPPVVRFVAGLLIGFALGAALGILIPGFGWALGGAIGMLVATPLTLAYPLLTIFASAITGETPKTTPLNLPAHIPVYLRLSAGCAVGAAFGAFIGALIPIPGGTLLGLAIGILVGAGLGYLADMFPPEQPSWLEDHHDNLQPVVIEEKGTVHNIQPSPLSQPDPQPILVETNNEQPDESLLPETNPENKVNNAFQLIQQ